MSMKPIRLPLPEDQAPEIVAAGEADMPAVMDLLRRRIAWMDEKNLYQWNKTGYLDYYPAGHFLQLVRERLLYAAKDPGGLVGVMALLERDPRWPNGDDGRALYVHHLATTPSHPGLGREMLAWAEDFARARGKAFLRLDSQRVNRPLSRYYEALGYRAAGTCVEGAYEGILREKPLVPAIET